MCAGLKNKFQVRTDQGRKDLNYYFSRSGPYALLDAAQDIVSSLYICVTMKDATEGLYGNSLESIFLRHYLWYYIITRSEHAGWNKSQFQLHLANSIYNREKQRNSEKELKSEEWRNSRILQN